ncbi:cytochrome c3 family protein, partial [Piscinibacter sp.]|uniref:cytochrome c3 family protein n=1 Tax=Piscinibacter sp. TaxID=1903157 RepID=UPI0035596382
MFERLNRALRATRLRAAGFAAALATCAMLLVLPSFALAQQGQASFDHAATGFPLLGAHEEVRCETCHIKGIFKGTPRECALCHVQNNQRGALAKPVTHIQTLQTCDSCHSVASFRGAMFSHVMVALGSCSSCHNGIRATGKSANHIATTASCDQCHSTIAFTSSLVPANHIPTAAGAPCSACHTSSDFSVMPTLANIHANAPSTSSNCEQCHG